ncbi:MAG: hypothetical protein M3N91_04240 [Pseudomonadota bacterium]|nr:hypothetical protein [Pseudomonadota bacterium]
MTGLANLLDDHHPPFIGAADYVRLLRQYARQQAGDGDEPDIQEDYNPDTGQPIVGLPRSHPYEHSTFVDLIINGLIGIRPRSDDILDIAPLIPMAGGIFRRSNTGRACPSPMEKIPSHLRRSGRKTPGWCLFSRRARPPFVSSR